MLTKHCQARPDVHRDDVGISALRQGAADVLDHCEKLVLQLPAGVYVSESCTLAGGTIGKHLRHTLDHFAAVLGAAAGETGTIDYDHRQRRTPMETDLGAAMQGIASVKRRLAAVAQEVDRCVVVRTMVSAMGQHVELGSTLARELAFATHHGVHHLAMMGAIAREFGVPVDPDSGKSPASIQSERSTAASR